MQIRTSYSLLDINKGLGFTFFLVIFWGYILYSFALLFELTPPIFGGFFGPFSAIACILFIATSLGTIKLSYKASPLYAFFIFSAFSLASITTLVSFFYVELKPATIQSLEMLIFWIAMYCIGFYLTLVDKKFIYKVSIALSILFLLYAVFYLISTGKYMLPFGTYEIENENITGYQSLARNIMVVSFLVIAFTQRKITQLFYTLVFTFILFVIGSRSEFYAFIIAIISYQCILAVKVKSNFIGLIILLLLTISIFITNYDVIMSSRQLNVANIDTDSSWILRNQMREFAQNTIVTHPILGSFGDHLRFSGNNSIGTYSHNVLSAYVNYGLVFFILYLFLCYVPMLHSAYHFKKNTHNQDWAFCFLITLAIAFLITLTKPVFWPATYLAWGIFLGTLYKSKFYKES